MTKEKKKQASMTELRNGSCLLLIFSPIIGAALFLMIYGIYTILFHPAWQVADNSMALFLVIPLLIMSYLLLRFTLRWRLLALFIKRVRDEYFRFIRMQDNVEDAEPVAEEGSDDDMAAYLGYEDEQQRGLSQS